MSETPQEQEQEQAEVDAQATPAAEAKADELGVDTAEVEGTGVEGRVLVGDVEDHAAAAEGDAEATAGDPPQATTQGDIVPEADEHPVDTTPPIGGEKPTSDPHEPMVHERGPENERGQGGGDGTVWNG